VKKIGIIDYGSGNIYSICNAFKYLGIETALISNPDQVTEYEKLVLPGVGAFGSVSKKLNLLGFNEKISEAIFSDIPILGICVGMQILFDRSTEYGEHLGLGVLPGKVEKIQPKPVNQRVTKIPHIGWSELFLPKNIDISAWKNSILHGIEPGTKFYFLHSYGVSPLNPENRLADTFYGGQRISGAVRSNNLFGTQFHPEKSGKAGLTVLNNFSLL
jgi:imidazole glycerol-phosphate synthase subunit HisH